MAISFKNLRHNVTGGVDADYEHPIHGTIPYTLTPDEVANLGDNEIAEFIVQIIPLDQSQANALKQIEQDYATALLASVGNPTEAERDTWPIKRECALAYQAGVTSEAQQTSLERYAAARGETVENYVAIVLTATDYYEQVAAYFEGIKTKAKKDITAATTTEQVETILASLDWSYSLGD